MLQVSFQSTFSRNVGVFFQLGRFLVRVCVRILIFCASSFVKYLKTFGIKSKRKTQAKSIRQRTVLNLIVLYTKPGHTVLSCGKTALRSFIWEQNTPNSGRYHIISTTRVITLKIYIYITGDKKFVCANPSRF